MMPLIRQLDKHHFFNYGFHPASSQLSLSAEILQACLLPASSEFLDRFQKAIKSARDHIHEAQQYYIKQANLKRRDEQFQVGDQVLLSSRNIMPENLKARPSAKLQPKFIGPYKVVARVGSVACRLELPTTARFHNVVHVSQIKRYIHPDSSPFHDICNPPPAIEIDGHEEFEVDEIIDHRRRGRKRNLQYLIRWKGSPDSDNTWEPEENLKNCQDLVRGTGNVVVNVL